MTPSAFAASPYSRLFDCGGRRLWLGEETLVMGIVNATPDSFSDGGRCADPEAAARQAERLVEEGAALIDIGGQSTRPGHRPVSVREELDRVLPVLERLKALPAPVSIDTDKPEVARAALAAGASLLNDVRGLQGDPALAEAAAAARCPVIVSHWEIGFESASGDALDRVKRFFGRSLAIARAAGIAESRIVLDPGIGFAKTAAQSLKLIGRLGELRSLGFPLLLGASRKSSLGHALGGLPPEERLEATLATTALAAWQGIEFVRVHDVRANVRVARTVAAVRRAGLSP